MAADFVRKVVDLDNVHLVALEGELDMDTAEGLSDWLVEIGGSQVVVDLSGLSFMDSSGISALVTARNHLVRAGNDLLLTRPVPIVRRALEVVGLAGWVHEWNPSWGRLRLNQSWLGRAACRVAGSNGHGIVRTRLGNRCSSASRSLPPVHEVRLVPPWAAAEGRPSPMAASLFATARLGKGCSQRSRHRPSGNRARAMAHTPAASTGQEPVREVCVA